MFPKKGSDLSVLSAKEEQTSYFKTKVKKKSQLPLCKVKINIHYINVLLSLVT